MSFIFSLISAASRVLAFAADQVRGLLARQQQSQVVAQLRHVLFELFVDLRILDLDRKDQLQILVAVSGYEIDRERFKGDIDRRCVVVYFLPLGRPGLSRGASAYSSSYSAAGFKRK
jgi:hypothetical protein